MIKLDFFNPQQIKCNKNVLIIGKRNAGKTVLAKDLLYHNKEDINHGIIFSNTIDNEPKIIPSSFIYGEYDDEILEKFIDYQTKSCHMENTIRNIFYKKYNYQKEKKINYKLGKGHKRNHNPLIFNPNILKKSFVIFDDCLYDKTIIKSSNVRKIIFNGRFYKNLSLFNLQYPINIGNVLKNNMDYIFIFRDNNENILRKIYELYAINYFSSHEIFIKYLNACRRYECLVLDIACNSNNLKDKCFYYKAKIYKNFKIGSKQLWKFDEFFEQKRK